MKRKLLALLAGVGLTASAQWNNGDIAPNFTATDLDGNSHNLYSYLDAGKATVVDVSAHWCPPCWQYHQSHAMKDLYNAHGPQGTDEMMVFFVDGDQNSTPALLQGSGNTQGNWVSGTPYPIIGPNGQGRKIATDFKITGFPTIYLICPDKKMYDVGPLSKTGFEQAAAAYCGEGSGTADAFILGDNIGTACNDQLVPYVQVYNQGTDTIRLLTIEVKVNDVSVATQDFNGALAKDQMVPLGLNPVTVKDNDQVEYIVSIGLGLTDTDLTNNSVKGRIKMASTNTRDLTLKVNTDAYAGETAWRLYSPNGYPIYQHQYTQGEGGAGSGPDDLKLNTHDLTIPDSVGSGCYILQMLDGYADGMGYDVNNALDHSKYGMYIEEDGGRKVLETDGNYRFARLFEFQLNLATSLEANTNFTDLRIYPSPVSDQLNVRMEMLHGKDLSLKLMDVAGKVVEVLYEGSEAAGKKEFNMDVSNIPAGVYLLSISTGEMQMTKRVVISR